MRRTGRAKFAAVRATWSDVEGGERQNVTAGAGKPVKSIRHVYRSKAEAQSAASAKADAMKRSERTLSLTLPGRPDLFAEGLGRIARFSGRTQRSMGGQIHRPRNRPVKFQYVAGSRGDLKAKASRINPVDIVPKSRKI